MLSQLQRGDEPALLPCRRSGFLRRPYLMVLKPMSVYLWVGWGNIRFDYFIIRLRWLG
jgi:hypothetical protein